MIISIISQNGHRINEYMADMLQKAIKPLGYTTSRKFEPDCDLVLMTNGVGITEEALQAYASDVPIFYFHDEVSASCLPARNVTILSQYEKHGDIHFPIAKLSLFDELFTNRQSRAQLYDFVYWGHKKVGREPLYELLPNNEQCLYIGEWEDKNKSHHVEYIRDKDMLLNTIAMGKRTIIDGSNYDIEYGNEPLRIYEALLMGVIPDTTVHEWATFGTAWNYYIGDISNTRNELTEWLGDIINEHG